MTRKWIALAAVGSITLMAAGASTAKDEKGPVHQIMEKVTPKNTAINKAVRSPAAFKKAGKDVVTNAEDLVKLFKQARDEKGPAEEQKKPLEKWQREMDDMIKSTEEFIVVAKKGNQGEAKAAFNVMKTKCTACHNDFRVEEDE